VIFARKINCSILSSKIIQKEGSMAKQLHKRFSTEEVKVLLQKYLENKKKLAHILRILKIKKRRFFKLLKEYEKNPDEFSIDYKRKKPTRKINEEIEKNIINELRIEKELIEDIHRKCHFLL